MASNDRLKLARDAYGAYESGNRSVIDELLTDDFTFYSPPDPGIDRAQYFERCWPNSETIQSFDFKRLIESGDEVVVTYEGTKTDGHRFRNTGDPYVRGRRDQQGRGLLRLGSGVRRPLCCRSP
jgi:ketosteroid isomerase-like protein